MRKKIYDWNVTIKYKNVGESLCEKIKENWGAKSHWEKYINIFFKWWKRRWTETQVFPGKFTC